MLIERGQYGQWCISDIINNQGIHRQYYGYTKAQAKRAFKAEIKGGIK